MQEFLLGQMLGCCNVKQLKYFCKYNNHHRISAKNRVLYLTYLELCKQLDHSLPFYCLLFTQQFRSTVFIKNYEYGLFYFFYEFMLVLRFVCIILICRLHEFTYSMDYGNV